MLIHKLRFPKRVDDSSFSPERKHLRSLFRKAARGNVHAFAQGIEKYVDFISIYLAIGGVANEGDRLAIAKEVLLDCWRYLPYTRRVSDFEHFLQVRLAKVASIPNSSRRPLEAPHEKLNGLSHFETFLLSARILFGWSNKSVRLALRIDREGLANALAALRSKLSNVDRDKLSAGQWRQIHQVSELLEGNLAANRAREVERKISEHYHALQFKADWLSYRCELAVFKSATTLSPEDADAFAISITTLVRQLPMEKPRLADSLVNQFSFVRLPLL